MLTLYTVQKHTWICTFPDFLSNISYFVQVFYKDMLYSDFDRISYKNVFFKKQNKIWYTQYKSVNLSWAISGVNRGILSDERVHQLTLIYNK